MKKIIRAWILLSIVFFSFSQGSFHSDMDMWASEDKHICHDGINNMAKSDTCDYICSLVFIHSTIISLDFLPSNFPEIIFSDNFKNFNTFHIFKPPIS